jgi:hypothetical protein
MIKPMITQHRGFQGPHPERFFQVAPEKCIQLSIGILSDGRSHKAEKGDDCGN